MSAIEWEKGLLDAWGDGGDDGAERTKARSRDLIAGYRRVLRKRYGDDRTPSEMIPKGRDVSVWEIAARADKERKGE